MARAVEEADGELDAASACVGSQKDVGIASRNRDGEDAGSGDDFCDEEVEAKRV